MARFSVLLLSIDAELQERRLMLIAVKKISCFIIDKKFVVAVLACFHYCFVIARLTDEEVNKMFLDKPKQSKTIIVSLNII
jgi:hypothetical protein